MGWVLSRSRKYRELSFHRETQWHLLGRFFERAQVQLSSVMAYHGLEEVVSSVIDDSQFFDADRLKKTTDCLLRDYQRMIHPSLPFAFDCYHALMIGQYDWTQVPEGPSLSEYQALLFSTEQSIYRMVFRVFNKQSNHQWALFDVQCVAHDYQPGPHRWRLLWSIKQGEYPYHLGEKHDAGFSNAEKNILSLKSNNTDCRDYMVASPTSFDEAHKRLENDWFGFLNHFSIIS